ncbi:hypothetical protein FRX31_017250 [Thalictrum thalictroides]|uniref:Uncharacterized protein n=1 Tax=Thalictrum thalictroides TaxID=46969 RepID=A0A7J6W830_THATH|nr:hypothetical protein FRX31_017250 [Thalictrum thalictroides]
MNQEQFNDKDELKRRNEEEATEYGGTDTSREDGDRAAMKTKDLQALMAERGGVKSFQGSLQERLQRLKNQMEGYYQQQPSSFGEVSMEETLVSKVAKPGNPNSDLGLKRGFLSPTRSDISNKKCQEGNETVGRKTMHSPVCSPTAKEGNQTSLGVCTDCAANEGVSKSGNQLEILLGVGVRAGCDLDHQEHDI